jgi:hypothetical protein
VPDSNAGFAQRPQAQSQAAERDTAVRLTAQRRVVEVPPGQSRRLIELTQSAAQAAQGSEPLAAPVTLRIELVTGVLEVAGAQVRWNGLTGRPNPALLLALQLEAERLLAR